MQLTDKEFEVLSNTDFLLTKVQVINKIEQLLVDVRTKLKQVAEESGFRFPHNAEKVAGKISKGENYRNLPYMVLDYPASFSKKNIFAFRTMFWWGNFFSCTLHLQGAYLEKYKKNLINNLEILEQNDFYISCGETPWQYHYGADNYEFLTKNHSQYIHSAHFLKLSRRIKLEHWGELQEIAAQFISNLLKLMQ